MQLFDDIKASYKPLGGFAAIGLGWAAYFAQVPVIKAGVGASDGAYGVALLLGSLGAVAAMWLAPLAQERAGRLAVPLSILAIAAGLVGAGLVPRLWALAVMMFVMAAGSGVVDVLVNAQVAQAEAHTRRSLMNLNHALYSFVYAGAALAVGGLRGAGWQPATIFALCAVLFAVLAGLTIGRRTVPLEAATGAAPALPARLIWLAGALVFFAFLTEAAAEGWSALQIERGLGGTAAQGALGPALLGLAMGVGRLLGHGAAQVMREGVLLAAACLLAAAGLIGVALAPSVTMALVGFAVAGLGVSVLAPLTLALAGRAVPATLRLAVIARVSVLGYGAFFLGPPLMGLVSEGYGLNTAFAIVATLMVAVALTLVPLLVRAAAR